MVAGYNPDLDADGQGARKLIDLLADVLSTRLETTSVTGAAGTDPATASSVPGVPSSAPPALSPTAAGPNAEVNRTAPADFPDETEFDRPVS